MRSLPGVVEQKSLKVQRYSDFGEDVLYRIEQRSAAGDYDLADIFGVDGATATAQGADYAYAIVNLVDSQSGSAETIGGFLSELAALF